ncbi:MAG: hypothetical protein ACI8Q1_001322 [Parvicella sp.]|jgi:hypothetical protein
MKIQIIVFGAVLALAIGFNSCVEETKDAPNPNTTPDQVDSTNIAVDTISFCNCTDSILENIALCDTKFPMPLTELDSIQRRVEVKMCKGLPILEIDTLTRFQLDSMQKAYEADMSLEIKEIEAEIENPISEECKIFLQEYADAIKSFSKFADKMEKNPDDMNLMIARSGKEDELYGFSSKPMMFQCSQNDAFKQQVEILNTKRDKLLSN